MNVWHRCAGKVAQLAQGEIDRLAKGYGGRSVPAHVTLMGGIVDDEQGIFDRAALLSSQLKVSESSFIYDHGCPSYKIMDVTPVGGDESVPS